MNGSKSGSRSQRCCFDYSHDTVSYISNGVIMPRHSLQIKSANKKSNRKSGGGRPTKTAAKERDLRLLEVAARLFLERGFDATSIDAVAEAARVSKPTVYGQYRDKRGLFEAVLRREIKRWLAPMASAAEFEFVATGKRSFEQQLFDLGCQLISFTNGTSTRATARVMYSQAHNFPDIADLGYRDGWLKAVDNIAKIFERLAARGDIKLAHSSVVAETFLHIAIGPASRSALHNQPVNAKLQKARFKIALRIFLDGLDWN